MMDIDDFPNVCFTRKQFHLRYESWFLPLLGKQMTKLYGIWDTRNNKWFQYAPLLLQFEKEELQIYIQRSRIVTIVYDELDQMRLPGFYSQYMWKELKIFNHEFISRIELIDAEHAIKGIVFTTDKRELGIVDKRDMTTALENEELWPYLHQKDLVDFRLSSVENYIPEGKHYEYDHFSRIFNRDIQTGMYPEVDLILKDKRFLLSADLETVKLFNKQEWEVRRVQFVGVIKPKFHFYEESNDLIISCRSLTELVSKPIIKNQSIIDLWNQIEVLSYDDEYDYCFDYNERVHIKSTNKYGIVRQRPDEFSEELYYGIVLNDNDSNSETLVIVDEADLEYDERNETIEELRHAHQLYLERISSW